MRQATMVLLIVISAVLGVGLYWAKVQVQSLEDKKEQLHRSILAERQSIRVLKAEWAVLNDPARLSGLAERHLKLVPVTADQITGIDNSKTLPVVAKAADAAPGTQGSQGQGSQGTGAAHAR